MLDSFKIFGQFLTNVDNFKKTILNKLKILEKKIGQFLVGHAKLLWAILEIFIYLNFKIISNFLNFGKLKK